MRTQVYATMAAHTSTINTIPGTIQHTQYYPPSTSRAYAVHCKRKTYSGTGFLLFLVVSYFAGHTTTHRQAAGLKLCRILQGSTYSQTFSSFDDRNVTMAHTRQYTCLCLPRMGWTMIQITLLRLTEKKKRTLWQRSPQKPV